MLVDNYFCLSFEQTNFVGDFYRPPNNLYFNTYYLETYYPEWSNRPNFPKFQPQESESELKELLKSWIQSDEAQLKDHEHFIKNQKVFNKEQEVFNKNFGG